MPPQTTRVPGSRCTHCRKMCTAATSVREDAAPSPGDFTVCWYCGHIMVFSNALVLRDPTDAELHEIAGNKRILEIQAARRKFK